MSLPTAFADILMEAPSVQGTADLPARPTSMPDFGTPVRVEAGTPSASLFSLDNHDLQWDCPGPNGGFVPDPGNPTSGVIKGTCPWRIIDEADLMGSPQIAVNHDNPNEVAIFSLHGAGTDEGPSSRSRDPNGFGVGGLTHTTFTTTDMGNSWRDNPWGRKGYGEMSSGVMDRDGYLYIAALWSQALGPGTFDYVFDLYKADTTEYDVTRYYQNAKEIYNREIGNPISEVELVFITPETIFLDPETNGTTIHRPAEKEDIGNETSPQPQPDTSKDRIMAVWFETAADWRNSSTGMSGWIDAVWTGTGSNNQNWTRLAGEGNKFDKDDNELIGPCMAASNPVSWNGKAYVACSVSYGYTARSRAKVGDIDIWSIDPMTGKSKLVDFSGLSGVQPTLAGRDDGYMALIATDLESPEKININIAFGWYGKHFSRSGNAGQQVHSLLGAGDIRDARITSMALTEDYSTLFVSYMERSNTTLNRTEVDPNNPLETQPPEPIEYHKGIFTFNECDGLLNFIDLQVGIARHPFEEGVVNDATGAFDDLHDGMEVVRDAQGELVYVAYGDHGAVQYGRLVGDSGAGFCFIPQPPPLLPLLVQPLAVATGSAATTVVGSSIALGAVTMITYLLATKKRVAHFAVAGDE